MGIIVTTFQKTKGRWSQVIFLRPKASKWLNQDLARVWLILNVSGLEYM